MNGSPPFNKPWSSAIWKESHNPILRGLTITMVIDHLLIGMILQVDTYPPCKNPITEEETPSKLFVLRNACRHLNGTPGASDLGMEMGLVDVQKPEEFLEPNTSPHEKSWTWHLLIGAWKRRFLLETIIFGVLQLLVFGRVFQGNPSW